ncbi:hypothetical protein F2Q69_00022842 [Brassica cretica]|uniref:Uncharacterized protein n=1 Tax=Brassica cretica TaxID=69181 RepID=A0A8S9QC78_BRACR|nr:hypothetical protein F2Q69_00022842 [Brassica cretica]
MDPNQIIGTTPSGIDNVDPARSDSRTDTLLVGPTGTDGTTGTTHTQQIRPIGTRTRSYHQSTIDPRHQIEPELESGIAPEKDRTLTT